MTLIQELRDGILHLKFAWSVLAGQRALISLQAVRDDSWFKRRRLVPGKEKLLTPNPDSEHILFVLPLRLTRI